MSENQKDKQALVQTTVTLANLVELASSVFVEVAGNEISNRVDGELLDGELLRQTIAAKVQANLSPYFRI